MFKPIRNKINEIDHSAAEALLQSNQISERNIKVSDLANFKSFKRINAMMNLEESEEFDVSLLIKTL